MQAEREVCWILNVEGFHSVHPSWSSYVHFVSENDTGNAQQAL